MTELSKKALDEFLGEAQEILEGLNSDLLVLDEGNKEGKMDPETMNNIFRGVHSLKGLAGMFGMDKLSNFAHHLENLLDAMRLGKVRISPDMLDILFEALEIFNQLTDEISKSVDQGVEIDEVNVDPLLEKISDASNQSVEDDGGEILDLLSLAPNLLESLMEYERFRLKENLRQKNKVFRIHASFDLMTFDQSLASLTEQLKSQGEVIGTLPSADSESESNIDFEIIVATPLSQKELGEKVSSDSVKIHNAMKEGEQETTETTVTAEPPSPPAEKVKPDPPPPPSPVKEKPVEEKKVVKEKPEIDFEDLSGFELEQSFELPDLPSLTHDVKDITTKSVKPSETEAPELQLPKELQTMLGGQSAIAKTVAPPEEAKSKRTGRRGAQSSDEPGKVSSLRSVSQTVRVDIKKLDVLMNIVGELVLSKSNLGRISDLLKLQAGFTGLAVDLFKETRQLERKLDELQSGVMEVRLVQVRQVFDKLSRVVRKISRDAGKDISFEIAGADTELDKLIIEELSDPLMHLIRNCIDHGVETPAEREAKGKPGQGTIAVSAYQKGNHVIIEIRDDGAGLDTEKICSIAMEKNLVDPYKIGELSERDIHNFIFLPGFSTKDEVSEISGRGVGMDVVKTNIANLSGMIDVFSKKNEGTLFTITLPITLAIIKALIIESGQNIFAIPLNGVIEILTIDREDILTIERREVIQLRDQTVPLTRLADLFRIDADEEDRSRYFTVIVGLAQNKLGIIVDKMLNQQDIVIKPLGRALNKINGFAGATDLGNQETILVLDIGALIEEALSLHQMEA